MPGPNSTLLFAGDGFSRALGERHRQGNLWVVWSDLEPPSHPARFWGWIQGPDGEGTVRAVANPLPDEAHTNVRVDIYLNVRAEDAGAFETIERRRVREGHALLGSVLFNREEPLLVGELAAALKGASPSPPPTSSPQPPSGRCSSAPARPSRRSSARRTRSSRVAPSASWS